MSTASLSPRLLRSSPDFRPMQQQCTLYAIGAGALSAGAAGMSAHYLLQKAFTTKSFIRRSFVSGLIISVASLGSALSISSSVYQKAESQSLESLRLRKAAEHYEYMLPILQPAVVPGDDTLHL